MRLGGRALAALLPDLSTGPRPMYTALAGAIAALVLDGRLAVQVRLPSERDLATALGLSRATITAAYDLLRAQDYLTSRSGSGSYVAVPPRNVARPSLIGGGTYGRSTPDRDLVDLSCATLPAPAELAPVIASIGSQLAPYLLDDGYAPAGLAVLRAAIAARFTARGVPTSVDEVFVTSGALFGLDLLLRLLIDPGDRVLTELPTYPGALDAMRAHGARLLTVPTAATGWQLDQMRTSLRNGAARLAYLVPDYQNPTGALVDDDARRTVFRAARAAGTTVIVDESFVDLGLGGAQAQPQPSARLDPTVLTVGSLSKLVWGGLRIGWVRAPAETVHRLAALRVAVDMSGSVLDQLIAAELFEQIDAIAAGRVALLRPRRDALVAALRAKLPDWQFTVPQGGLSLWAQLPEPLSTPLTMLAGQRGVLSVPGPRFGPDGTLERFLRLPFALPAARLTHAVACLTDSWQELRSSVTPSAGRARPLVVA